MSGLAKILLSYGKKVLGSDSGESDNLEELETLGVKIYRTHLRENISNETHLVVYSGAIKKDNPELLEAEKLGIPIIERSELLGIIASQYKKVIAISGTHGKTTTTAMIGEIFVSAGGNPTIHIGGNSIGLKSNTVIGGDQYFIVEACEYRESFRFLNPYIGIITNIELDHLDYYKNMKSLKLAFQKFANNSKLIITGSADIQNKNKIDISKAWTIKNLEAYGSGYNFNVYHNDEFFYSFRLNMIGIHNVSNALFAIAVSYECGIEKEVIASALSGFMGVSRRYEKISQLGTCSVIIDYAHHPTELSSSIDGIKSVYKNILYIFQPHTYSRTLKLFDEFIDVLCCLPNLLLFETYPAREQVIAGGTAMDLFSRLEKNGMKNLKYMCKVEDVTNHILNNCRSYDCVLILGAGNLAEKIKLALK